jgi:hypothetical protein
MGFPGLIPREEPLDMAAAQGRSDRLTEGWRCEALMSILAGFPSHPSGGRWSGRLLPQAKSELYIGRKT